MKLLQGRTAPKTILPLSLSGQLGVDDNFALVSGGIKAETKQALERIRLILERNGSSLDHVVKCTMMLADMSE